MLNKNGKVQILANKKYILSSIDAGYTYKYIFDDLQANQKINVNYCQFRVLIHKHILSSHAVKSSSLTLATQKPIHNNSSKRITPRTPDNDKSAKQALREIQNDPNKNSFYD